MKGTVVHFLGARRRARRIADELRASGLFDERQSLDLHADAGVDPVLHYVRKGAGEGCRVHPLFDEAWYAAQHPEVVASGHVPLLHYLREGERRGSSPNPLFDPGYYRERQTDLQGIPTSLLAHYAVYGGREGRQPHPLFDGQWYTDRHPAVAASGLNPLAHYLQEGLAAGFDPHPLFDSSWYTAQYPEVAASGLPPLLHYLQVGAAAGLDPHPLFDSAWYTAAYPEVSASGLAPLVHYLREGEGRGHCPNPLFDPVYYRAQNPDLHSAPLLTHYAVYGCREGRRVHPLFDSHWYVAQHPEVEASGLPPLVHYLRVGALAGFDPNPLFDSRWYAAQHPEVGTSGLASLVHYLRVGAAADCDPHPLFDAAWYRQRHGADLAPGETPLVHYVERGAALGCAPNRLIDPAYYLGRYQVKLRPRETALAHFAYEGARRGHRPSPRFDFCIQFFRDARPEREAESPFAGWFDRRFEWLSAPGAELPISLPAHPNPRVSIVIPAFGPLPYTLACLRSISRAETQVSYEVIVVDDDPERGLAESLARIPNLRVVANEQNLGFLESAHRGAALARGEELVFLNNDALVTDGWLDELVQTASRFARVGVVGSKLVHPDGSLQEAGGIVWSDGTALNFGIGQDPTAPRFDYARMVDYVSAASLWIRRESFLEMGGFDSAFRPAFYEDTDLCFRAREKGLAVLYQPASVVVHFGGASYGRDPSVGAKRRQEENRHAFRARWAASLKSQPAPGTEPDDAAISRYRRRALVIDSTMLTPDQDSGSLRMFRLLQILGRFGFHVSFAPSDLSRSERYEAWLRRHGIDVPLPSHPRSIPELLETTGSRLDLVILSRPNVGDRWLDPVRLLCPRAVVLYDTVDLHFLRRAREMLVRGTSTVPGSERERELRAARRADGVIVVSEADRRALLAEDHRLRVHLLSNIHEVHPCATPFAERENLLFIGGFRHAPNVDAICWFVRDVMPLVWRELPGVGLHVVGSEMPDQVRALASDRVFIEGYVEDVSPFLARCRLSVAPLRYGAGVKGKVNQSMSYGLPCVATRIAAEGIEAESGVEILVADGAEALAAGVVELYRNESLWRTIAEGSLRNIGRHFSVQVAEDNLAAILREHALD